MKQIKFDKEDESSLVAALDEHCLLQAVEHLSYCSEEGGFQFLMGPEMLADEILEEFVFFDSRTGQQIDTETMTGLLGDLGPWFRAIGEDSHDEEDERPSGGHEEDAEARKERLKRALFGSVTGLREKIRCETLGSPAPVKACEQPEVSNGDEVSTACVRCGQETGEPDVMCDGCRDVYMCACGNEKADANDDLCPGCEELDDEARREAESPDDYDSETD